MPYANAQAYKDAKFVQYWLDQLEGYHREYKRWEKRCERIVKRYRDDRQEKSDGSPDFSTKFNALWSNVQTLLPAVYAKTPQPVIERRYLDKDPVARFASMTLERALEVQIEECGFHSATKMAVQDYLLPGRGQVWVRYEPTYGTPEDLGPEPSDDEGDKTAADDWAVQDDEDEDGEPTESARPVTWEKTYFDYVGWKNFRHSTAPVWEEVRWVAKREYMTRRELRTRWPDAKDPVSGQLIADMIPLQDQTFKDWDDGGKDKPKKQAQTAEVWEIWDKTNLEVVFIASSYPLAPLERTPDPLKLMNFWPCPKPLYATTTSDTLVPVPDYLEYQDQAEELDQLTARIKALTDAVRVNGVYDASIPELKRILQEGADNRLVAVQKWSEFSAKGGLDGAIDFIPLKDIVSALLQLYDARDRVKADMAEITGISDIVRGQAQGAAKTATEQRIKGQFATLRLQDRQAEVARFCRDILAIAGEIVGEQFSEEILAEMTGMVAFIAEEVKSSAPPPQPQPQPGPDGQPMPPSPEQMQQMQAAQQQQIQQTAQGIFQQAVALLKNDKMRTFRIDIETNSTIEVDKQAAKEAATEAVTALGGLLEKALPIGQMMPAVVPAIGQTLLWLMRQYGVARDVEGAWEQAIDKTTQMAKNPPPKPPSPEEVKAQAEMQKQQMENQRAQQDAQRDQQMAQMEMDQAQQRHGMELEKMQAELQIKREELLLKREELAMKERELQINATATEHKAQIDAQALDRQAELNESDHERAMEAGDRQHELAMETAEFKAKQAQKPKVKEPA